MIKQVRSRLGKGQRTIIKSDDRWYDTVKIVPGGRAEVVVTTTNGEKIVYSVATAPLGEEAKIAVVHPPERPQVWKTALRA